VCERQRKCIGAGSSGCMFEQAVADSHSDDVARATPAATHTHTKTHMCTNTCSHTKLPTPGSNIIISPPG